MKYSRFQKPASVFTFLILMVAMVVMVQAQYGTSKTKTAEPKKSMATPAGSRTTTATLTATLVDAEKKAAQKAATVQVKTTGIALVDPAKVMEKPHAGQGHLHYQVDSGPIIATTTTKLSFHELSSGPHKITVMLAANDHSPLGPQQTLEVTVP